MNARFHFPSRKSKWAFWVGAPFVAVIGYIFLDLVLGALRIYQQGAVKWDGVTASGTPTGGNFSLLLGHHVTLSADIIIMIMLMVISVWFWLFAAKKLFK
jgi:hypothetical protein